MRRVTLGRSGLTVSEYCLGTMTWGSVQNNRTDAFRQLDYALDHGIDFLDTAEMYAVPPLAETQGATEAIIGAWLAERGNRNRVIIASKVTGAGGQPWMRGEGRRLDRANIRAAIEASLGRLRCAYIDLYQTHWPDRACAKFGLRGHPHDRDDADAAPIEETLDALNELVKEGKIRAIGVSNETPWGVMRHLELARQDGTPRIASIQNPYNLLNRQFETGLSEIALREDVPLLAYSPLAGGTLSGKYLGGKLPPGSRRAIDHRGSRYITPSAEDATQAYLDLAAAHGLSPTQMALAFVASRPFTACPIIGATNMAQLEENIAAASLTLDPAVLEGIEAIQARYPDPCP